MNKTMIKGFLLGLYSMGVVIDKTTIQDGNEIIYISVPEHSYFKHKNGTEIASLNLAKAFKETMNDLGENEVIVKAKIRYGEYWTKEMDEKARKDFEKFLRTV